MAKYIGVVTGRRILLSNADNVPVELVQNDKDTTIIDFELSKIDYIAPDVDLSQLNVTINYANIDKDTGESVTDIYTVDKTTVEGDSLKFSWTVGSNASVYAGKCIFQLVLTLTDADDVITQQWDSTKQSIEVHASLEDVNITQPKSFVDFVTRVKKSVSDRNTKIATAITEKGVATEPTDSADVMAENIRNIPSGGGNSLAGLYQERSGYTVNVIRLGKETTENKPDSNEHYWVPAVDDTKMQEIATALDMKINTITSGREWILYRGDDAHKNTGIKFVFEEIGTDEYKLIMQTVVNGKADLEQSVNLYKDINISNNTTAAHAYLCYLCLGNDNVIFGVGNDTYEILLTIVSVGHNISTNEKMTLYTFIVENRSVYMYTETSSSKYSVNVPSLFQEDSSTITVLTPIPIISENILSDSVFRPICFSHRIQSLIYEHRAFTMNDTSYFVTNGGQCAVVVSGE